MNAVGNAVGNEAFDGGNDIRDGLDGADVVIGCKDIESVHVGLEKLDLALGQFPPVHACGGGALQQGVIDIRDVLDVGDPKTGVPPGAVQEVKGHIAGGMTHVGRVVRRDAADIHGLFRLPFNLHYTAKGCVEQP